MPDPALTTANDLRSMEPIRHGAYLCLGAAHRGRRIAAMRFMTCGLWIQDRAGRYRTQAGTMLFLYGYVRAADGTRRFGWMAQDALEVSSGCS